MPAGVFCSGRPTACELQLICMKHASHVRFVMAFLAAAALIPLRTSAASPSVVFSEINWGGSTLSQADEWIELVNITDEIISLTGWTVDGAASGDTSITLPELSLLPQTSLLVSNYPETSTSSTLASTPAYVTTSLSLSNSAFGLTLRDASGNLVDSAGDGTLPPAGQSAEPHSSMQRVDSSLDGALDTAWGNATDRLGFDDGFEQYGSPGINSWWIVPTPTMIEETSVPVELVDSEEPTMVSEPVTTDIVESVVEHVSEDSPLFVETVSVPAEATTAESVVESESPEDLEIVPSDEPVVATIQEQIISPDESIETVAESSVPDDVEFEQEGVFTTTDEPENPTTHSVDYSSMLHISALLPSPANGESEWVEITNTSSETVALVGWTLREGSGKITAIPEGDLATNTSLTVRSIKGNLNNGGDLVELISPDGLVQDSVAYQDDLVPDTGETLKRTNEGWVVVTTTINETTTTSETTEVTASVVVETEPTTDEVVIETVAASEPMVVATNADTTPPDFSSIRLSALYPNTKGGDADEEFIEIENAGTVSITLTGLFLVDTSGKTFDLSEQSISASSVLSLSRTVTNLALNNDRETISLQTESGTTIDSVSYENAPKGSTFVRTNHEWAWSPLPSATQSNVISTDEKRTTSTPGTGTSPRVATHRTDRSRVNEARALTAEQIQDAADGTRVQFSGVVAIAPGVSGRQTFYASDETGAIQIYKNDAIFPDLYVGDRVTLTGTLSMAQGEKRIKIMKTDTLTIIGHEETIAPAIQTIETLSDENVGDLVGISGTIREIDNGKVILEDGADTIVVKLPTGSSAVSSALIPGTNVSIAGLLTKSSDGFRLLARSSDDIHVTSAIAQPEETTGQEIQAASDSRIARTLGLTVLLILLAGAAREFYPRIKHWYAKRSPVRHASQAMR